MHAHFAAHSVSPYCFAWNWAVAVLRRGAFGRIGQQALGAHADPGADPVAGGSGAHVCRHLRWRDDLSGSLDEHGDVKAGEKLSPGIVMRFKLR